MATDSDELNRLLRRADELQAELDTLARENASDVERIKTLEHELERAKK